MIAPRFTLALKTKDKVRVSTISAILRFERHSKTRRVLLLLTQIYYFGKVQQNELPNLHFKVVPMLTFFNQLKCFHSFTNL